MGFIGVFYGPTAALTVTGGTPPYTFTVASGTFPPGLTLVPTNGVIEGFPTTAGNYSFIIAVTDLVGCTGFLDANIVISCPSITITAPAYPPGQTGVFYGPTAAPTVGGTPVPPLTFSVDGVLPPGLLMDPATGVISGTPLIIGSYSFLIKVTDEDGCTAFTSPASTIDISCPAFSITTASLPSPVTTGVPYPTTTIAVSAGFTPPLIFSVSSGMLPPGLNLTSTGVISGTPIQMGTYTFTIAATDENGCTAVRTYTVIVNCPTIMFTPVNPTLLPGTTGVFYTAQITASNGTAPYIYSVTAGSLPPGLDLNADSGLISGTPTAIGVYTFTIGVTDANGCPGAMTYTLTITCGTLTLHPTLPALPSGACRHTLFNNDICYRRHAALHI